MTHTLRRGFAIAGVLTLALTTRPASAQDGTTGFLIPYQGRLELDGAAVNASVELRLGLFNTAAAGTGACLENASLAGCGLWADAFTVPVSGGAFTVLLGSGVPIPDAVLANPELYVAVAVKRGATWTRLQGLQRLVSTPYAVRARAGHSMTVDQDLGVGGQASVGGSLGVGTATPAKKLHVEGGELRVRASHNNATPDIATFSAQDQTQGVGIGYNRIEALGGNTNQDLHLVPRGSGTVSIDGASATQATRNTDGTITTYSVSRQRYVLRASYTATTPVHSYLAIPQDVLNSYCADEDGCRVTLRMRDWNGAAGSVSTRTATSFSLAFHYGETIGGQAQWRREAVAGPSNGAIVLYSEYALDNNNVVDHVIRNHDCYFSDGYYAAPSTANDTSLGMGLLNWNGDGYQSTCELILDD